jgi:hypothetical protein
MHYNHRPRTEGPPQAASEKQIGYVKNLLAKRQEPAPGYAEWVLA